MKKILLAVFILFTVPSFSQDVVIQTKEPYEAPPVIRLTHPTGEQVVKLVKGQQLIITLRNPGDGGYIFDVPQYDASVISLINTSHINPDQKAAYGDFGTDTWIFVAIKNGTTHLKITATQPFAKNNHSLMFIGKLAINNL